MFEELAKTQKDTALQLEALVKNASVPPSVLFAGSRYSGRMFASLSLAKELGVGIDNIIILSDRDNSAILKASINLFEKSRNKVSAAFLKNSVLVFLSQYQGALVEKLTVAGKKSFSDAAECRDLINEIEKVSDNEIPSYCEKLRKALDGLLLSSAKSSLSIGQVRALTSWLSSSSLDSSKHIVVIEGVENASVSACNALLKTLEEPPEDTYFILLSENPGRILFTILSRVRKFYFQPLSNDSKNFILSSLFVDPNKYADLENFFLENSGVCDSNLRQWASQTCHDLAFVPTDLYSALEKNSQYDRFFSLLAKEIAQLGIKASKKTYLINYINNAVNSGRIFNQQKRQTLDMVFLKIREALEK